MIELSTRWKEVFPEACIGLLAVKNAPNKKSMMPFIDPSRNPIMSSFSWNRWCLRVNRSFPLLPWWPACSWLNWKQVY